MINKAIVWFRNDLRIHDNEALTEALAMADVVIPVFVFDDRVFKSSTSFGFTKTGAHRCRFVIETINDLRSSLESLGSTLVVRSGITEDVLFDLVTEQKASWVFCNRERTQEEVEVQDALEKKIWTQGAEMRYSRGKMLYYTSDLPFPISHTPDTFTSFRKEVEKYVPVREPISPPDSVPAVPEDIAKGEVPTLVDFGHDVSDSNHTTKMKGGESAALAQLEYYLWETDNIATYKKTRNEMLGWDYSSKLSGYLAHGCISAKKIYAEVKEYERQRTKTLFNIWSQARTGIPMIDANMRELNETGFMSNRGRQNVASFLVNDMKVHWLLGAEYFESLLIDYDPCSNYGNWNYIAGVGVDPRPDRWFNVVHQGKRYDTQGKYVHHWIPELENISGHKVHEVPLMSAEHLLKYGLILGKDYPKSVINDRRWR